MSIREITPNFPILARNISHRFPSFLIAFVHCFCPNFQLLLPEFREKAMGNSGKTNGEFGQNQWENLGKSNEKTRKAAAYISGKNYCFCPNIPLLFPEFPIAFARISHGFCPNFPLLLPEFFVFKKFGGHSAPPPPLPSRLLRLWGGPEKTERILPTICGWNNCYQCMR